MADNQPFVMSQRALKPLRAKGLVPPSSLVLPVSLSKWVESQPNHHFLAGETSDL